MKFSKILIAAILIFLLLFTIACLLITAHTSVEPSALIVAVFGFCGVECGVLGWIKNTDTKNSTENNSENEGDKLE